MHHNTSCAVPLPAVAAGRPRVPPASPVVFDVKLLYIPGITDEDEEY
jgi:peptidylprolyl isomerase